MYSEPSDDREKVEIYIQCHMLPNLSISTKTFTQAILYEISQMGQTVEIGRTESIFDERNPKYTQSFIVDFIFERTQNYLIEIRDIEDKITGKFSRVGSAQFRLGTLMGSLKNMLSLPLANCNYKDSRVVVFSEKVATDNYNIALVLRGIGLNNFGTFTHIHPIVSISKLQLDRITKERLRNNDITWKDLKNNTGWIKVYQTEKHEHGNVVFQPIKITSSKLCSSVFNAPLKLELSNYKNNGNHKLKGEIIISAADLLQQGRELDMYSFAHGKSAGIIKVERVAKKATYQFTDYLRGGLEVSLICGIDFTASNGIPSAPTSLHFIDAQNPNQYQKVILSVTDILLEYDYDKVIQGYGFGAKPLFPGFNPILASHFFPMSGDWQNCGAQGTAGLFALYNHALMNTELAGPTFFSPLLIEINKFTEASKQQNPNAYTCVMIITDGEIHDKLETIDQLVYAANNLPLSVIIIGVGDANFSSMEDLDSDGQLLRDSRGNVAKRDIVQFVPFSQFANRPREDLAAHVLYELPGQVVSYFDMIGVPPNRAAKVDPTAYYAVNTNVGANLLNLGGLAKNIAQQNLFNSMTRVETNF